MGSRHLQKSLSSAQIVLTRIFPNISDQLRLRVSSWHSETRSFSVASLAVFPSAADATGGEIQPTVNSASELWSWGKGEFGQLGHGDYASELFPRPLAFGFSFDALTRGDPITPSSSKSQGSSMTDLNSDYSSKGSAFAPSSKDSSGQTQQGDGANDLGKNTPPTQLVDSGLACGLFHTAAWHGGKLWLWGKGDGGRLGFAAEDSWGTPRVNQLLPPVHMAALGGLHSAAVTKDGQLYTWGFGGFGSLGHGKFTRELSPTLVKGPWIADEGTGPGNGIVMAAAGGAHTAAVTGSGVVFTWGRDEGEGRLGHPDSEEFLEGAVPVPVQVAALPVSATAVSCGGFFTAALSTAGEVWTWGGNSNSELGRGSRNKSGGWRPGRVTGIDRPVVQLACGGFHSAAVDDEGRLWTWGRGANGQLGNTSLQTQVVPHVVRALRGTRIRKVSCGSTSTAAISENGELFVFGKNGEGQLGVARRSGIIHTPVLVTFADTPRYVVDVAAGANHGVALVRSKGTL